MKEERKIYLGKLIRFERKKRGITPEALCTGVCSLSVFKRLESGIRIPGFFTLKRLIERLGISINKLEFLHDEESYTYLCFREKIEDFLERKDYQKVEEELSRYRRERGNEELLHKQYQKGIEGILASKKDGNHEKAEQLFTEALHLTVKEFSFSRLFEYTLGESEILFLLMLLNEGEQVGKENIYEKGEELLDYIETFFQDEEVKVNVYTKACILIGESFKKHGKYEKALDIVLKGERLLTENGLLINLPKILDSIVSLSYGRNEQITRTYEKMRKALKDLYEEYDVKWSDTVVLWKNYRANEIHLLSEFFRDERVGLGISQESLAEELGVDTKTVSRIECGKTSPKVGTLRRLREYFALESELCETKLITEDFTLLELEREIVRLLVNEKEEAAEMLYCRLKKKLSRERKENRQYLIFMDLLFEKRKGKRSPELILEELKSAYCITREKKGFKNLGEYVPRRIEALILNNMALCYKKMGKIEKGIALLEKAIISFEKSKVNQRRYYASLLPLYANLAVLYEESSRFEDGLKLSDKAIRYSLFCMRAEQLPFLMQEKAYTHDLMTGNSAFSKEKYRQSYQIMNLMRMSDEKKQVIEQAYKEWYKEEIFNFNK